MSKSNFIKELYQQKPADETAIAFARRISPKVKLKKSTILHYLYSNRGANKTSDIVVKKIGDVVTRAQITIGDMVLMIPGNCVTINGNKIEW